MDRMLGFVYKRAAARDDVGDTRLARRMRRAGRNVEWRDIDATTSTAATETTGSPEYLPPWLLRDKVFQFLAAPPLARVSRDGFNMEEYQRHLAPLRGVCQQWQKLVQFLSLQAQERIKSIEIKHSSAAKAKRLLNEAASDGPKIQELSIVMGEYWGFFLRTFLTNPSVDVRLFSNATWCDSFFRSHANLIRLDLSMAAFECVEPMLKAASTHAPRLRELVLQCGRAKNQGQHATPHALIRAMSKWHQHNGGLRLLTIPSWVTTETAKYVEFIEAVTTFCPQIEYLLGRMKTHPFNQTLRAAGNSVPLDVWSRFCGTCTQLKEMWWMMAPWTQDHLNVFTLSPKKDVEVLDMETDFSEAWADAKDLSTVETMLKTLPKLRSFNFNVLGAPNHHHFRTDTVSNVVNAVVEHCPRMERFRLRNSLHNLNLKVPAALVEALVQKETMRELHVSTVLLEDDTLLQVLAVAKSRKQRHKIIVDLDAENIVHRSIHNVLEFLLGAQVDHFNDTVLELHVCSSAYVDTSHAFLKAKNRASFPTSIQIDEMTKIIQKRFEPRVSFIHVQIDRSYIKNKPCHLVSGLHLSINVPPPGI